MVGRVACRLRGTGCALSGVSGAQKARQPSAGLGANCPLAFELADASPGPRAPARRPRVLRRSVVARLSRGGLYGNAGRALSFQRAAPSIGGTHQGIGWDSAEGSGRGKRADCSRAQSGAATDAPRQYRQPAQALLPFFTHILASVQKEPACATGLQRTQGSEAPGTAAARAHDEQGLGPLRAPRGRVGLRAL